MREQDYLLISGLQHFVYCKRQWALIHIEAQWSENYLTTAGQQMHKRAHNAALTEKRGDLIVTRDMAIVSHSLKARGKCDVVEFVRDDGGVTLFGREGLWLPVPVEYKRGKPKVHDADRLQLCAQAICLEEMLAAPPIEQAFLYYGETKRREAVHLTADLRDTVRDMFEQMQDYHSRGHTPRVKANSGCSACSLSSICLPKMPAVQSVSSYIKRALEDNDYA